jgi:hypothetical protein
MNDDETPFEPLGDDEIRLLRLFAEHGVRAIVIGGYAVRVHGYFRPPADLGLVVDPAANNPGRMRAALTALGVADAAAVEALFVAGRLARWDWRDGLLDHHVDLFSAAEPFTFSDLAPCAIVVDHEGVSLLVMSRDHLVAAKGVALADPKRHETKKAQDREDLEAVLRGEESRPTAAAPDGGRARSGQIGSPDSGRRG